MRSCLRRRRRRFYLAKRGTLTKRALLLERLRHGTHVVRVSIINCTAKLMLLLLFCSVLYLCLSRTTHAFLRTHADHYYKLGPHQCARALSETRCRRRIRVCCARSTHTNNNGAACSFDCVCVCVYVRLTRYLSRELCSAALSSLSLFKPMFRDVTSLAGCQVCTRPTIINTLSKVHAKFLFANII